MKFCPRTDKVIAPDPAGADAGEILEIWGVAADACSAKRQTTTASALIAINDLQRRIEAATRHLKNELVLRD